MDLDDFDAPPQAPTRRPSRFLPKLSKPKSEPKSEPSPKPESAAKSEQEVLNYAPNACKSDEDDKPIKFEMENEGSLSGVSEMEVDRAVKEHKTDEDTVEEDAVVREIDVYFTPQPIDNSTQIYVLQYPLRPLWRPYELEELCEEIRVKPSSAEVEIDLGVNDGFKNYDHDSRHTAAMKKQTLTTSWKPPRTTSCAIGILMDNKLHLNPIHAVVQMRPALDHLKSGCLEKKNNAQNDMDIEVKTEANKIEKSINSSKKPRKMAEVLEEQNTNDAECWVTLKYHGSMTDYSSRYLQKMIVQDSCPIQFSMSPCDYVNSLCPGTSNDNIKSGALSIRSLLMLPLEVRVKKYLLEADAPAHRFNIFKHLAPDASIEDLLGLLRQHAQLVQGLWVPKSSLLFPESQGLQPLARDYILFLFSQNQIISHSEVDLPKALGKALREFLTKLSTYRPSLKEWKFKEPTDLLFLKDHQDIAREQQENWEVMGKRINSIIHGGGKSRHAMKTPAEPSIPDRPGSSTIKSSHADMAKAANGTSSKRTLMSDETREALPKALEKVFQRHQVCSIQTVCQGLQDLAVSTSTLPKATAKTLVAAAEGVNAPLEELQAIICQVAINVHGVYVSKSSRNPENNSLRKVVVDLFCARGPNAKLKKADVVEAARIALKKEISLGDYNKVMSEICESRGAVWVLRSGDGGPK